MLLKEYRLLVESIIRENASLDQVVQKQIDEQNATLKKVYKQLKKKRIGKIHYLRCDNLIGKDHEGTIDGTHPNDLGQYRLYEKIRKKLKRIM